MADYGKLKVTELRELLKERGISSTGLTRKQQIVEALEAHDAEDNGEAETAQAEEEKEEEAEEADAPVEEPDASKPEAAEQPDDTAKEPVAVAPEEVKEAESNQAQASALPQIPDEIHQPVSNTASKFATPQRTSPAPSEGSTESRKRKRRSPTPPVSAETINKRLKAAEEEELPKLPEDAMNTDEPAPAEGAPVQATDDDAMDTSEDTKPSDVATTPSQHPATTALYIRNLVRPVQPAQLRDHLSIIALPPNSAADDSIVTLFHLDTLRSHAFAQFSSISAAARARSALHDHIWPEEPSRRPLWVDFIPDDKVQEWIDTEINSETSRRDAKRWEVVYETSPEGVSATHQEITSGPPPSARQPSISAAPPVAGPGMPNAPLGPRSDRRRPSNVEPPAQQSESFNILDERFKSTTAKPKLYFLPHPESLAEKRLAELEKQTSRDWADVRVSKLRGRDGQLVRYTFENGDELVDGGVDLGDFGRGGGGDRGGRRRGGGFRGRR